MTELGGKQPLSDGLAVKIEDVDLSLFKQVGQRGYSVFVGKAPLAFRDRNHHQPRYFQR